MERTQYKMKLNTTMSTPFTVNMGLKQGDALSPILFNLTLKKSCKGDAVRRRQSISKQRQLLANTSIRR